MVTESRATQAKRWIEAIYQGLLVFSPYQHWSHIPKRTPYRARLPHLMPITERPMLLTAVGVPKMSICVKAYNVRDTLSSPSSAGTTMQAMIPTTK